MEERKETLVKLLYDVGACACGVAVALPVDARVMEAYDRWIAEGKHAGMAYMEKHRALRQDPRLLLEGARSVISVAFDYCQHNPCKEIATYALGLDYHLVLRDKLTAVVEKMKEKFGGEYRVCIDSAPMFERYWAEKCGVGFRSPVNGSIVVPGRGCMVFLAEILTTLELEADIPISDSQRQYTRETSVNVCPSGAISAGGEIDSRKCINYLTIEHRGDWSSEQKKFMASFPGTAIFGCDICQNFVQSCCGCLGQHDILPEFKMIGSLPALIDELKNLKSMEDKSVSFPLKKSPLGRAGLKGLKRNSGIVKGNRD